MQYLFPTSAWSYGLAVIKGISNRTLHLLGVTITSLHIINWSVDSSNLMRLKVAIATRPYGWPGKLGEELSRGMCSRAGAQWGVQCLSLHIYLAVCVCRCSDGDDRCVWCA